MPQLFGIVCNIFTTDPREPKNPDLGSGNGLKRARNTNARVPKFYDPSFYSPNFYSASG